MASANNIGNRFVYVEPLYACYWLGECNGTHELVNCSDWKNELRGKVGYYFSENGEYRQFKGSDNGNMILRSNPRGVTEINLLIFREYQGATEILLVTRNLKEKNKRKPLTAFPSSNPFRKEWNVLEVVHRTLGFITNSDELIQTVKEEQLRKFFFSNASVVYPIYFNERQADLLDSTFRRKLGYEQLHWVRLNRILNSIEGLSLITFKQLQEDPNSLPYIKEDSSLPETIVVSRPRLPLWSHTLRLLILLEQEYGIDRFLHGS